MDHPYIVKLIEARQSPTYANLVFEFCNLGTVKQYCVQRKGLLINEIAYITKQVLLALHYMHREKKGHRNVKVDNILVTGVDPVLGPKVKLAGFGYSADLQNSETS